MFARVSTYRAADADKLLEGFQSVTGPLEQMDGFSHAYFLVDRASGKGMSMTVWESEQALSASVAKADELRKQVASRSVVYRHETAQWSRAGAVRRRA